MKIRTAALILFISLLSSCGNKKDVPNTDIDVARSFIKDILENDFPDAEKLMLKDDTNQQYFDLFRKQYTGKDKKALEAYKQADIIINEISNVNDSVTIVNYSNTVEKKAVNKLKVVKSNGQWLVDLKYTFSGNM